MKNFIAKIVIILAFIGLSMTSSKALVLDLYSVSGVNTPEKRAEMVAGYEKFKTLAEAGGAEWIDFTLSMKIKGDGYNETMLFAAIYENNSKMMKTNGLFATNQPWFDENFDIDTDQVVNAVFETPPGADVNYEPAEVGNTLWYGLINVTDFLNFVNRFPQMPEKMSESGIDGQLGLVSCTICPASMDETTHMMFLAADSLEEMGDDMDSFDFNMQRWFYSNIRPFVEQVDTGMNMVIAN
jgi:hypothetical protein|tara:strand:- start:243 stop:962 length:720 start_codon:yes stop_codon:yes gene_type:complete